MTELAYLSDSDAAYMREFTAQVVALPPGGVVLDRTYFYPAGGGQQADHGTIGLPGSSAHAVVDVTRSGASAVHRIRKSSPGEAAPLHVGAEVIGVLDWGRRYRHMRLHTGQHLLSALIFSRTGIRTREATMSGSGGTVDLERGLPADFPPGRVAEEANMILAENRPVTIRHVRRADWEQHPTARSGLVPLPRHVDPVRIIEIAGIDACPCGGTHVRFTGEVARLHVDAPVPLSLGAVRLPFRLQDVDLTSPPE